MHSHAFFHKGIDCSKNIPTPSKLYHMNFIPTYSYSIVISIYKYRKKDCIVLRMVPLPLCSTTTEHYVYLIR